MKWEGIERSCDNCINCDPCSWKAVPGRSMYTKCVVQNYREWFPDADTREEYYINQLREIKEFERGLGKYSIKGMDSVDRANAQSYWWSKIEDKINELLELVDKEKNA